MRNLLVIGEAARYVSPDTRALAQEIEWGRLVALRNILVHRYFGVDEDIVWDVAANKCPELLLLANELNKSLIEELP